MSEPKKLLAVMIELAEKILVKPTKNTSFEGVHAALLLAHAAWNRTIEPHVGGKEYIKILPELQLHNPRLWEELKSRDCEGMIRELMELKQRLYPHDQRFILVCGTTPAGNVHVEFVDRGINKGN